MNREDFMLQTQATVSKIFESKTNGIMNLVRQAWAEGKRNAEVETLRAAIEEALGERDHKQEQTCAVYPTWKDWLIQQDVLKPELIYIDGIDWQPAGDNLNEPIPADIAEKLGIEPKEE